MSNCRWWIRGVSKFRVFKKKACTPFQDGVDFSWKGWDKEISEVRALKPGDTIWNPYHNFWDNVKKVVFVWKPITRFEYINDDWIEKPVRGSYINEFYIETTSGYYIYESPSLMKIWCENYGIVSS